MERQAVVISCEVGGRGNRIFEHGTIVFERNFPPGNFDKLIATGFLKEKFEEPEVATGSNNEPEEFRGSNIMEATGEPREKVGELIADGETHEADLTGSNKSKRKRR